MILIKMLGTGGATPYGARTTPMLLLECEGHSSLVDCGSGATLRLGQAGVEARSVDSLWFTHFHADHCVDFPVFVLTSYVGGAFRDKPLRIFGPAGTKRFVTVMLEELFPYIPKLISGISGVKFELAVEEVAPGQRVDLGRSSVRVGNARHSVPAVCYRFETDTEAVTVSGDTEFAPSVAELAEGSRLLIHECPFPVHMGAVPDHTQASEVGRVAADAHVGAVVLTHLFQEVVGHEEEMKDAIRKAFAGEVIVGRDLMTITVAGQNLEIT